MENQFRHLDDVSESVRREFKGKCPLYNVYILPQRDVTFRSYVFFNTSRDIEYCKSNGIVQQIIDFTYSELERVGRGSRDQIVVAFEFDSDENVIANFEGDYFLRLR